MEIALGIIVSLSIMAFMLSYATSNYLLLGVGLVGLVVGGQISKEFEVATPQWAWWVAGGLLALNALMMIRNIWLLRSGRSDEYLNQFDEK